ncbi:O-antigen ligase [Bosea sp. (in: a-proteobacteria)]|uniref:O-antigen ligase family protein n=1 Tax=Bosea sp. (in: a-proteobacteria) TaxID=1871050 RepID=UPI0026308C3B|nr:O-antigen ligase family protein [Bosea sp. (in: a-proteobacteria)]MCO5092863.1 O-antigen ligase domain-containing protein [Bosea sp. (in: a-proteobacteria)]
MSALAETPRQEAPAPRLAVSYAAIKRGTLWLLGASSGLALIEPSPYEIVFLVVLFVFTLTGIRFSQKLLPLALLLLGYNIGGIVSLIPWMDDSAAVRFTAVSVYLMITAVFIAGIMSQDAAGRLETLRQGYLFAAWVAGVAAILGYFDIGGLGEIFTLYGRAAGTFKDPNVLGPYLALPIVYVLQRVLTGQIGILRGLATLSIPLAALFFTFSRGAWGVFVASTALMIALTFLMAPSSAARARIVAMSAAALVAVIAALLVALSFEDVRAVFEIRASLEQDYDQGVTGRFGNQLRAIPMLLEAPNGFGPLRFRWHFNQADPHNVYINAFASYGWLGGLSWIALMAATIYVGWRLVFRRGPAQLDAIAIWSVLFVTILQGLQIDSDHWRHLYLMMGLVWGLAALAPQEEDAGVPEPPLSFRGAPKA